MTLHVIRVRNNYNMYLQTLYTYFRGEETKNNAVAEWPQNRPWSAR